MAPLTGDVAQPTLTLETPVQHVRGIGPRRAEQLVTHGIMTVGDLVEYSPFRYEDRTQFRPISTLREGEWVLTRGAIASVSGFQTRNRRMSVFEVLLKDSSGSVVLKFFNQSYLSKVYRQGMQLIVYGQVKRDTYGHHSISFMNPECEISDDGGISVHSGRVVPVYRRLGDLRTRVLRQIMFGLIADLPGELPEALPAHVRRQYRLLPKRKALELVHFPEILSTDPAVRAKELQKLSMGLSPAHKRMIFEELFQLQVGVHMVREKRIHLRKQRTIELGESVREAIKKVLPFHPTAAQKRVLKEIADDLRSAEPMSRLLQGDVGSGKTIVAAQAAIIAVENGFQAAVMAPTEILAEQHYFNFRRLLGAVDYSVDLVKGGMRAQQKKEALARIRSGETHVAIGTHALIQKEVAFHNLALVIIDEQHRFGVIQRDTLRRKGTQPDLLVMTATPIPRSLALTLYGDLDVSVIDELPPGRKPIETRWYGEKDRQKAFQNMRRAASAGHQVYVVYPLVEESEKTDLRAATEMAQHLQRRVFPELKVGLLHGKMKSSEKDAVMTAFSRGETHILVSTTVIEVGVDVPNATLMVIEHAERFGLAQLHQLRGRVGRGADRSLCVLIASLRNNPEAQRRLEIMCETNDGFRIAEVDLELRGPGEFLGTRQSGIPAFKFANLIRDRKALEIARAEAERFVHRLRTAPDPESGRIADRIAHQWRDRYGLALAG